MSSLSITSCPANWRTVCSHLVQQPSGLGLRSALPQQLGIFTISRGSSPLNLRRGSERVSKLARRSLPAGPRADSEREERPNISEGNVTRGLDELDDQLRALSTSDRVISDTRGASKGDEKKLPLEEGRKLDWPVFGDGFALYIGVGLILITLLNNILFRVFLGPPVRTSQSQGTEVGSEVPEATQGRRERYKLRSFNDPKYFTNAPPIKSREDNMAAALSSPGSSITSEQDADAECEENTNRDEVITQNDQIDQYDTDLPNADTCKTECSSPHMVGVASSSTGCSTLAAESSHDVPVQENQELLVAALQLRFAKPSSCPPSPILTVVAGSRRDETQSCENDPRFSQYISAPMCDIDHQYRSVPTIGCHGLPLRPWAKECHKWQGLDCSEGEVPVCPYGPDCKFHHSWPPKRSSCKDSIA